MVSNGTAVLGLGNLGALASKPVMEGKAVLFNKFAGVEAIDLCIDAYDPDDDSLNYVWEILPESTDIRSGGDAESKPEPLKFRVGCVGWWPPPNRSRLWNGARSKS